MNIEFRIWSHVINKWITDLSLENLGDTNIELNELLKKNQHITYQLYTGYNDKNGKKIFEGDILLIQENDPYFSGENIIMIVEHRHGGLGYKNIQDNKFENLYSLIGDCEIDDRAIIIGNILENPDLLV